MQVSEREMGYVYSFSFSSLFFCFLILLLCFFLILFIYFYLFVVIDHSQCTYFQFRLLFRPCLDDTDRHVHKNADPTDKQGRQVYSDIPRVGGCDWDQDNDNADYNSMFR